MCGFYLYYQILLSVELAAIIKSIKSEKFNYLEYSLTLILSNIYIYILF